MRRNPYFTTLCRKHLFAPRNLARGVVAALVAVAASSAGAHPHAWIDVGTTFVTSGAGQVTAIRQEWLYDNLLSDGMLVALKEEGGGTADLQAYAADTMDNLKSFGYFMQLSADGQAVPVGPVREFSGAVENKVIVLRFTAPLARPVDPRKEALVLKVYDPTYFIEMLQNPDQPPRLIGQGLDGCTIGIVDPDPSDADYARALALDRSDKAEPDFGDLFAQQIHLRC